MRRHDSGGHRLPPIPAWLDNSYASLLAAVLGFVLAAAGLRALLGRPLPLAAGTPLAAAALLCVIAVPAVWGGMRGMDAVRDGLKRAPGIDEREQCLVDGTHGNLIPIARRLAAAMPEHSRFALVGDIERVCFQLTLLPRVMVGRDAPRDFTVYAGGEMAPAGGRRIAGGVELVEER